MKEIVFLYLLINGWTDYKTGEVDLRYTVAMAGITGIYKAGMGTLAHWWGILPGLLLLVIAVNRKEKIGSGDGWIVMATGWALGMEKVWNLLMIAFLAAGGVGLFYLFLKKKQVKDIPFVPFLLLGFLVGEGLA